jgi:hypothetical protein
LQFFEGRGGLILFFDVIVTPGSLDKLDKKWSYGERKFWMRVQARFLPMPVGASLVWENRGKWMKITNEQTMYVSIEYEVLV